MIKTYRTQENAILIGHEEITFDYPIDYCVEAGNMIIVLLSIPPKVEYNQNVFGVNALEKKIKWQIEKREFRLEPYTKIHCKYSDISYHDGQLILNNWCDVYLIVDPITGAVLEERASR